MVKETILKSKVVSYVGAALAVVLVSRVAPLSIFGYFTTFDRFLLRFLYFTFNFYQNMKQISYWSLLNPWKAQTILLCCHLLSAVLAIYAGVWLFAHNILLPKAFLYVGEILFLGIVVCYPVRRSRFRFWKTTYLKQKSLDTGFVLCYLLMAATVSNTDAQLAWNDTTDAPTLTLISMKENPHSTANAASKPNVLSKKVLRQQFKSWVVSMKAKGETADLVGEAIAVILLLVLFIIVIAALACTIACSSSMGLGFFALIAFELLILVLLIMGIKNALIKRKANYKPAPNG